MSLVFWNRALPRLAGALLCVGLLACGAYTPSAQAAEPQPSAPAKGADAKGADAKGAGDGLIGQEAPWFAGWTLDQQLINRTRLLKDDEARGHLLVFFATWCKPCKKELTQMVAERQRLTDNKIRLVLVDYAETADLVRPWLKQFAGLKPDNVIVDQFGKMALSFGVAAKTGGKEKARLPRSVLIDASGKIRAVYEEGTAKALVDQSLATLDATPAQ